MEVGWASCRRINLLSLEIKFSKLKLRGHFDVNPKLKGSCILISLLFFFFFFFFFMRIISLLYIEKKKKKKKTSKIICSFVNKSNESI
jgi:hypothetical protein